MAEDVRIIKNKREIETAFLCLLEEKQFSKITIADICSASLTSRSTFYSHYLDKYDLLEKIVINYAEIIQQIAEERFSQPATTNIESVFKTAAQTYLQYQKPLNILLKVHIPNGDLREKIEEILYRQCYNFLENKQMKTNIPISLIARLYMSNVLTLINWILEYGVDDQAIEYADKLQAYIFSQL